MNEIIEAKYRDEHMIANEINVLTTQAQKMALHYSIEIGTRLQEAKDMLPHGGWGKWLETEVSYSQSTAENFMKIATEYGNMQGSLFGTVKSESFEKLEYTKLVALLAVPSKQREDFVEQVDAENISVSQLKEEIRKLKEENNRSDRSKEIEQLQQKTKEEQRKREDAMEQIRTLEEQLAELKEIDTAKDSDDTLEQLRKEALEEAKNEMEGKLKKEREKAKKAAEKAAVAEMEAKRTEALLKAEQEAAKEREQLLKDTGDMSRKGDQEQIERLKKQLEVASDEAAIRFKVLFSTWQKQHEEMLTIAEQVKSTEMKEKLKEAIKKICSAWTE